MSHARSLIMIPAPIASLRLSCKWNGIIVSSLSADNGRGFFPTSLLLFFDNRFHYPLGLLAFTIQIGLCRPSHFLLLDHGVLPNWGCQYLSKTLVYQVLRIYLLSNDTFYRNFFNQIQSNKHYYFWLLFKILIINIKKNWIL